jgi:hypothetical protein
VSGSDSGNIILFPGAAPRRVLVFRIELVLAPRPVWRRIAVPEGYSFWDLHVAIQDAMGWRDCHLHLFTIDHPGRGERAYFGIPESTHYHGAREIRPGWEWRVAEWFREDHAPALYTYDFGDDWQHEVALEQQAQPDPAVLYPRCLAGEGAGPPENCGGVQGYAELLAALSDPDDPDHAEYREWLGTSFDPAAFDAAAVRFDDPRQRWERSFGPP